MSFRVRSSFRRSRRGVRPTSLTGDEALIRFALRQGTAKQVEQLFSGTQQKHTDMPLSDGQLPLHVAVDANRPEVVTYLLKHGAHVDKTDPAGWTALHRAVYNGNINLAKILLDHGADPGLKAGHLLPVDLAMDCDSNMTDLLNQAAKPTPVKNMEDDQEVEESVERKEAENEDRLGGRPSTHPSEKDSKPSRKSFKKRTASLFKRGAASLRHV